MRSSLRSFLGLLLHICLPMLVRSTIEPSELMGDSSLFCLNRGTYDMSTKTCICKNGFIGARCSSCDTDFVNYPSCIPCREYCLQKNRQTNAEDQKKCACSNTRIASELLPINNLPSFIDEALVRLSVEGLTNTIKDYIQNLIRPPLVLTDVDLNILSGQSIVCRLRFGTNSIPLTGSIEIKENQCQMIFDPTSLSWSADLSFATSLDGGSNWMAWMINCKSACTTSSYEYRQVGNSTVIMISTTAIANNATIANNSSTSNSQNSTRVTTITPVTTAMLSNIIRNHSVQFSLNLPPLADNTTAESAASSLVSALSQSLGISSQQFNVSVSIPSARVISNAKAQVLLYGTAQKNVTMILDDLKKQLSDSNSLLRKNPFTSNLTSASLGEIISAYTCDNVTRDTPCSTNTLFVSLNFIVMNLLIILFFAESE